MIDSAWEVKKPETRNFAQKLNFKAFNPKVYSKNQIIESLWGIFLEKKDKSPKKVAAKLVLVVCVKFTILPTFAILP